MKITYKQIISLIMTSILTFLLGVTAFATDNNSSISQYRTYSEEFPDAYIITEVTPVVARSESTGVINLDAVSATVFIEESYGYNRDGEFIITNSRLLSEEEVMDIGIENFNDIEIERVSARVADVASNSRGKLTITFSGSYYYSGSGVVANVSGNASWSGSGIIGSSNPAAGADFFGLAWSGSYTASGSSCTATLQTGGSQNVYLSEASPNAGRVYEFNEYMRISGGSVIWYVSDASLSSTLSKNALEGNGNTAEVVLKYIHTYQALTGSISISASGSGVGAGFSLSNTPNQWGISCILTGIPY
jgi:hypothetical protein